VRSVNGFALLKNALPRPSNIRIGAVAAYGRVMMSPRPAVMQTQGVAEFFPKSTTPPTA
jgi:hypothetical protein